MARETKQQREERLAREESALAEQQKTAYQLRLMSLLERAMKTGQFELTVKNFTFEVSRLNLDTEPATLSLTYTYASERALSDLEWEVDLSERELAEAARREQVRRSALAKLTKEEREELGL